MIQSISNESITSLPFPIEGEYNKPVPLGVGDNKDSIVAKEAPLSGFSYVKMIVVSIAAIAILSIAAFFVKLLYKDEVKQAELDAEINYHRNQLKEAKEGKPSSEV